MYFDQFINQLINLYRLFYVTSGPAPRGGIPGPFPPNDCLCPPNRKLYPPSKDCVPKKLIGPGLLECKSRLETRKTVLIALEFVSKNFFVWTHTELHETWRIFWDEELFFFYFVFTSEFVDNRTIFEMKTRSCGHFWSKDLFLSSPFSFDPHFRIHIIKVLVPPPFKFIYTPPQSRYPGAGPASP